MDFLPFSAFLHPKCEKANAGQNIQYPRQNQKEEPLDYLLPRLQTMHKLTERGKWRRKKKYEERRRGRDMRKGREKEMKKEGERLRERQN